MSTTKETWSFTRILNDGDQLVACGFNTWAAARQHIIEAQQYYAGTGPRHLRALAFVRTEVDAAGRMVDMTVSHYSAGEVAEMVAGWQEDAACAKAAAATPRRRK